MEAVLMPPPILMSAEEQDGEQGGGRDRGGNLGQGLSVTGQARLEADGDADRDGPGHGDEQGEGDAEQSGGRRAQGEGEFGVGDGREHENGFDDGVESEQAESSDDEGCREHERSARLLNPHSSADLGHRCPMLDSTHVG